MLTSFLTFFHLQNNVVYRNSIGYQVFTYYIFLYRLHVVTPFFKGGVPQKCPVCKGFRAGYTFF